MTAKYNYNNPIMQQHLKNATNKKHINVSNGRQVQHQIATGGVPTTGVKKTTIYIFDDGSNNTSTTQKTMSTAEKFALGASIATGALKGTAEIISAIAEVKAKNPSSGSSKPASTSKDTTSYSTTSNSGGKTTTTGSTSIDMSDISSAASVSKADETSSKIDSAISAYKDDNDGNSNVKDRKALQSAVGAAQSQIKNNNDTITSNQKKYDSAVKDRDEYKTQMDKEQAEFQTKLDDKNKELDTAKNETLPKAKNLYEAAHKNVETKQAAYDSAADKYNQAVAIEKDSSLTQEEKDAKLKELGGTSKELKSKMDEANKELNEAKKFETQKLNAYKDAQNDVDKLGDEIRTITANKETALTKATTKLEGYEAKVRNAASKPGVKDTEGNIADNSLAEANQKLQESVDKGNEALGAYAK